MAKTAVVNIRVPEALKGRLKALAASKQPETRFVSHEEAMDWLDSLGTERPRPIPKGRRFADLP